jgi:succinyl-CoA synthetase alpha subunit
VASTVVSVRQGAYVDSVTLLQVTAEVRALAGVEDAALVMGTELNRELLRNGGLWADSLVSAGPNDLVIAVRASSDAAMAIEHATRLLFARQSAPAIGATLAPHSLKAALRAQPESNLAVISVPGAFAAAEARQALAAGLHVFLFSDNVPIEDEIDLKRRAREHGLLVMGPDCGTSILNGVGLGFANAVRSGSVGLIGASGTGLQEVTTLLHQGGAGVSHAIGTGGRDMDARVGGSTTLQALELLRVDPKTRMIVLVSKTPDAEVAQRVLRAASETGKPVLACLFGYSGEVPSGVTLAPHLFGLARLVAPRLGDPELELPKIRLTAGQRQVRGLFCGGTLCEEAATLLESSSVDHVLIDFGDDRYTRGRAHPMIDPTLRNAAIVEAGADPRVAALLLDVILGFGSHPDPAGATLPAIREAHARGTADGRELAVLAHVVGTDADAQGLTAQTARLRAAGVHVYGSNVHAATAAGTLVARVAER